MDALTWVIVAIVVVLVGILGFLTYSGLFYRFTIQCSAPAFVPSSHAYLLHTGPYENIGPVFGKLNRVSPKRTLFGVYYDDPNEVPAAKLRSIVGADVSTPLTSEEREALLKIGCNFGQFPECRRAVVTKFPYRNYLSILIAVWRVYPSLMKYMKEHNIKNYGPCMEVYKDGEIQYAIILENIDEFFVPEIPKEHQLDEGLKKTN